MKPLLQRAGLPVLCLLAILAPTAAPAFDLAQANVQSFIDEMQREHGFEAQALRGLLARAEPKPQILELMDRPAERTLAWWEYRQRFVTEDRIANGARVWEEHQSVLELVASQTGVPEAYLVAITGVETFYGRITGNYRVLDSLATLAFDYPPRAEFFRKELAQFLLMTREEQVDPAEPKGSYAGAMGIAQFMPSSFRNYAVDADGDGHRDLWAYGPDVFASIANYFTRHGWREGEPVLTEASNKDSPDDPARARASLDETVADLRNRGYEFTTPLKTGAPAMAVPAPLEDGMSWRVGFGNFYVITRYNRSLMYAMAVHDLAEAITARRKGLAVAEMTP